MPESKLNTLPAGRKQKTPCNMVFIREFLLSRGNKKSRESFFDLLVIKLSLRGLFQLSNYHSGKLKVKDAF
jgi:hypothetical protein